MNTTTQWLTGIAGLSLMGLLLVAVFTIPAWIPLVITIVVVTVLAGGNLDGYYEQDIQRSRERREKETEENLARLEAQESFSEMDVPLIQNVEIAPSKTEVLETIERSELMKDLTTIGVNTYGLRYMSDDEILASLSKEDAINLRELRRFLNDR